MERPGLPANVEILAGTDVDACWDQFLRFEALHYGLRLCNPFSLGGISRVVDLLAPDAGNSMVDLGCGHGELLIQVAERVPIKGTGIDLSPWALRRAAEAQAERVPEARLRWILGDASALHGTWDIVTALGVSWIWGGYRGTVEALLSRCPVDGTVAIGDLQLRSTGHRSKVGKEYRDVLSREEQLAIFNDLGVYGATEVLPGPDDWADSDDRMTEAVSRFAEEFPGKQAEGFKRDHHEWLRTHRGDHEHVTWSVFVGWKGELDGEDE